MSGLEVVGGISAIIGIIDGLSKVWTAARKDLKFSDTFIKVSDQLPILLQTLQICYRHLELVEDSIPDEEAQALYRVVQRCRTQAEKLQTVFRKTIPGEHDKWYERYQTVARRLGQGSRVEELVEAITKDSQMLVNYHVVKSVQPDLGAKLEQVTEQIRSLPPSLPSESEEGDHFSAGHDLNIHKGSGKMNVMSGHGIAEYSGSGSPNLYFGPTPPAVEKFSGSYSHSSLQPVTTYVSRPDLERQLHHQLLPTGAAGKVDEGYAMRTVVVWGLGGAGKSQLVRNHVRNHRQRYLAVFWVEAGQKKSIERDYVHIYRQLCPDTSKNGVTVSVEDAIVGVKSWLQRQERRCLWVMDGADDTEDRESESSIDLNHYLPEASQLDRILTTRSPRVEVMATQRCIAVGGMSLNESVQLFQKSAKIEQSNQETQREISTVVESLFKGHPLAITQAGAYISQGHCTIIEYPRVFERQRRRLLTYRSDQAQSRHKDAYTSFEVSAEALKSSHKEAASDALQLLSLLSMLGPIPLSLSVFKAAWEGAQKIPKQQVVPKCKINRTTSLRQLVKNKIRYKLQHWRRAILQNIVISGSKSDSEASTRDDSDIGYLTYWHVDQLPLLLSTSAKVWDPFRLLEALRLLEAYSLVLVTKNGSSTSLSMHPLTHIWARVRQSSVMLSQSWLQTACLIAFAHIDDCHQPKQQHFRPHLPHLLSMSMETVFNTRPQATVMQILLLLGWLLRDLHLYAELHTLCQQIFQWLQTDSRVIDQELMELYMLFAQCLLACEDSRQSGLTKEAVLLIEQVVKVVGQKLSEDDPNLLILQHVLAVSLWQDKQYSKGYELMRHVAEHWRRILDDEDILRRNAEEWFAGMEDETRLGRVSMSLSERISNFCIWVWVWVFIWIMLDHWLIGIIAWSCSVGVLIFHILDACLA